MSFKDAFMAGSSGVHQALTRVSEMVSSGRRPQDFNHKKDSPLTQLGDAVAHVRDLTGMSIRYVGNAFCYAGWNVRSGDSAEKVAVKMGLDLATMPLEIADAALARLNFQTRTLLCTRGVGQTFSTAATSIRQNPGAGNILRNIVAVPHTLAKEAAQGTRTKVCRWRNKTGL